MVLDVTQRKLVSHRRFGTAYRSVVLKRWCETNLRCVTSHKTTEFE
jgi:hypothetical protein